MRRAVERLRAEPDLAALRERHRAGESPWLVSAKLKLIDACNLRCFMCDYWKRRREGELDTAEWCAVLADLAALGCRKVHFTGGEVFLRRDAVDLVAEATRLGMRVNLTTNGTRLDKARLKALLSVPVRGVTLSIDAPIARIHDGIRGRAGAFRLTVKTLDRLLDKRGPKTRIRINTVVNRRNYHALVEMPGFLRSRAVDGWLLIPMERWVGDVDLMGESDIRAYNARVAPVLAETVKVPGFDPWVFGRGGADVAASAAQEHARGWYRDHLCHAPWFHTLVGPSGDVYACCGTHRRTEPLGNVRTQPLRDVWRADPYVALRRKMLLERLPHCHRCDDFLSENAAIDAVLSES